MRCGASIALLGLGVLETASCSLTRQPLEHGAPASANIGAASDIAATSDIAAPGVGLRIAQLARAQIGATYRYGGASPAGFDCSGLVSYVYAKAGITTPRTAAAQQLAARSIPLASLQSGDLVFFRTVGPSVDHVVIYVGDGLFVHAPHAGRFVQTSRLDDPWYTQRIAGAGRLW